MRYSLWSVACLVATALFGCVAADCSAGSTTTNALSYMCSTMNISTPACYSITSGVLSNNFACAQSDGVVETTISCLGIGQGKITCFTFASNGKTSGSCGSCDTSMGDDGTVSFLSKSAGDACIGKSQCKVTIQDSDARPKAKIIAYCGKSTSTQSTACVESGARTSSIGMRLAALLAVVAFATLA